MAQLSDLEYLKLSKGRRLGYKAGRFFAGIPVAVLNVFRRLGTLLKSGVTAIGREIKDIVMTFVNGDWKTKLSYLVMGFGCLARGQILRGLLFLRHMTRSMMHMSIHTMTTPSRSCSTVC